MERPTRHPLTVLTVLVLVLVPAPAFATPGEGVFEALIMYGLILVAIVGTIIGVAIWGLRRISRNASNEATRGLDDSSEDQRP